MNERQRDHIDRPHPRDGRRRPRREADRGARAHLQGQHRRPARLAGAVDHRGAGRRRGVDVCAFDPVGRRGGGRPRSRVSTSPPTRTTRATAPRCSRSSPSGTSSVGSTTRASSTAMAEPKVVDARNLLDPAAMRRLGLHVPGRRALMPRAVVTGGAGSSVPISPGRSWRPATTSSPSTTSPPVGARTSPTSPATPASRFVEHDVSTGIPVDGPVDAVLHFASPASPPAYLARPLETLAVGLRGHAPRARARPRPRRAVPARVHERDLRRPARAPAARDVPRQRELRRPALGLRRGEAVRRGDHDGVPPRRSASTPRSCGSSTRTVRGWPRATAASSPTSSSRRSPASRSPSTATAARPVRSAGSTTRCAASSRCSRPSWTGPMNIGNPDEFTVLELAEARPRGDGLGRPRSCSSRCRSTTPPGAVPTSRSRADVLGWKPEVELRTGVTRLVEWHRATRLAP